MPTEPRLLPGSGVIQGTVPKAPTAIPRPADLNVADSENRDEAPPRPVNLRFLVISIVLVAGATLLVHVVHARQMERMAVIFRQRAEQQQETGEFRGAARDWRTYLSMAPEDFDARLRLADALAEAAESPSDFFELYRMYERILRSDPDLATCRRKLIDVLMLGGRYTDAVFHINFLLLSDADDSRLLRDRGRCLLEAGHEAEAARDFAKAVQLNPLDLDTYRLYAFVLADRLDRAGDAIDVLHEMVASNQTSFRAYLICAEFWNSQGNAEQAALELRTAYRLAPRDPQVVLAVANMMFLGERRLDQLGLQFDVADLRARLTEILDLQQAVSPGSPGDSAAPADNLSPEQLFEALALLDLHQQRFDGARQTLERGLAENPRSIPLRSLLADVLLEQQAHAAAGREIELLAELDAPAEALQFFESRLAMSRGEWLQAAERFEQLGASYRGGAYFQAQVQRLLGECYDRLGHEADSLAAYRRAADASPASVESRMRLAAELLSQGRLSESVLEYDKLADVPGVDVIRARLKLAMTLREAPADRDWNSIERILDAAARNRPNDVDVQRVRADLLLARGDAGAAEEVIRQVLTQHAQHSSLWIALAEILQHTERPDDALEVLREAQRQLGDRPELVDALVRHWQQRDGAASVPTLLELWDEYAARETSEWFGMRRTIAEAVLQSGDHRAAQQVIDLVLDRRPNDATLWMQIVDWSLRTADQELLDEGIRELRRIEGDDGAYWRLGEVGRCILAAQKGRRSELDRAEDLLDEAAQQLSGSPRLALARAEVRALSGDLETAIRWYREAIVRGERRPGVIRRLVWLLAATGRDAEAAELLQQFQRAANSDLNRQLRDLDILIALRMSRFEHALALATQHVQESPESLADLLLLGQIQRAAGLTAAAGETFRAATSVDPAQPQGWIGLVAVLAELDRVAEAEQVIESAQISLAEDVAVPTIGTCYELLGRPDAAAELYTTQWRDQPDKPQVGWQLARFYLRQRELGNAETVLRRVIELAEQGGARLLAQGRRSLAELLISRGDFQSYREAVSLIDANLTDGGDADDLRLKAQILATHPTEAKRRESIRLMLELEQRLSSLPDDDQLRIIKLYVSVGDWRRARERLIVLVADDSPQPDHLAYGIGAMLEHGEVSATLENWLQLLARAEPDSLRSVILRSRYLALAGQTEQAIELLVQTAHRSVGSAPRNSEADQYPFLEPCAAVLANLAEDFERKGRWGAAARFASESETLYRFIAEHNPLRSLLLAQFLGKRWRLDEALDVCAQAREQVPLESVAQVAVELLRREQLRGSAVAEESLLRVRTWLQTDYEAHPDSAELALQLATVANLQADYAAAISYYEATLERAPDAVSPRNELGILLGLAENRSDEGLAVLEPAIEVAGPLPVLLDTRAMLHITAGNPEAALEDLTAALAEQPTPARYFHLAQTQDLLGDRTAAREAFRRGLVLGLSAEILHPLERDEYHRLRAAFL